MLPATNAADPGRVGGAVCGKEIKPGTYYVKGDIENCYWERQDRNGNTIDNYVTLHAKRVQATIRSSDYTFTSQDCGTWRPVN